MIPEAWVLTLAATLFAVGLAGVLLRRNPLAMLMCVVLMVNAANLVLVGAAARRGLAEGQALVLFVIGVEAAELAIALAVISARNRLRGLPEHEIHETGRGDEAP